MAELSEPVHTRPVAQEVVSHTPQLQCPSVVLSMQANAPFVQPESVPVLFAVDTVVESAGMGAAKTDAEKAVQMSHCVKLGSICMAIWKQSQNG